MNEILEDKLKTARIGIYRKDPFFAHILTNIEFKSLPNSPDYCAGMGTDGKTILYDEAKVVKWETKQIYNTIKHEIMHIVLMHPERLSNRHNQIIANICADLKVSGYVDTELHGTLKPTYYDTFEIFGIKLENISTKSSEILYDEFCDQVESKLKGKQKELSDELDQLSKDKKFRDILEYKKLTPIEKKKMEKKIIEASEFAKAQGKLPKGMELYIDDLLNPKVDWRTALNKKIIAYIPYDSSYSRPSKKSCAIGCYLPRTIVKPNKIAIAIDTSGSIGRNELTQFKSEIVSIAKLYPQLNLMIYTCDAEIQDRYELKNGNIAKFLTEKISGGGGTDFKPIFDECEKENIKMLIYLTDGYGTYPENTEIDTIWVKTKNNDGNSPFGETLYIDEVEN